MLSWPPPAPPCARSGWRWVLPRWTPRSSPRRSGCSTRDISGARMPTPPYWRCTRGGAGIKEIVRRTGHSRGLVRRMLRGQRSEVFRTRESSLEAHLPWLDARWDAGDRNGAALWRDLRARGFRGSLRVVTEWATRRRRADTVNAQGLRHVPSARTVARLMTAPREDLSQAQTVTVAAIETAVPALAEARNIVEAFHVLIRRKQEGALDGWLAEAAESLLAPFARGLARDHLAVRAAIATAWSNAQAEGQITKLKLVKRQMYGRGKLDLLQARVIGPFA